jgi:hypothetical protein
MGNLSYGLDKIEMMEQKLTVIYYSVQYIYLFPLMASSFVKMNIILKFQMTF